jgi:hypothetical protein
MNEVDPLTSFVARSIRADVSEVRSEIVVKDARRELERIRFLQDGAERTLILKRVPPSESLEVQLLPFLARKTDRVGEVRSRGIPPPAVPAWPWVLIEDLIDARSACEGDPRAIVRARAAIERAVAKDGPALRALGVPALSPAELVERAAPRLAGEGALLADARTAAAALSDWPASLCHGDLRCGNARLAERGVVLVEWTMANIGCGLLDVARLAADVGARGDAESALALPALYAELAGVSASSEHIRAAELIDRVLKRPPVT